METDANKMWQEYLQKCCEVGQLILGQEELPSNIDNAKKAAKQCLEKYKRKANGQVPPPQPTPKPELVPEQKPEMPSDLQ
jgi:hypothetical protein